MGFIGMGSGNLASSDRRGLAKVVTEREAREMNPGKSLVPGQTYVIARSNGELESGWKLMSSGPGGKHLFYKEDYEVSVMNLKRSNVA